MVQATTAASRRARRPLHGEYSYRNAKDKSTPDQKNLLLGFVIVLLVVSTLTTLTLLDSVPERRATAAQPSDMLALSDQDLSSHQLNKLRGQPPTDTSVSSRTQPQVTPGGGEVGHHNLRQPEAEPSRTPGYQKYSSEKKVEFTASAPPQRVAKDETKASEAAEKILSRGAPEKFLQRVINKEKASKTVRGGFPAEWLENFTEAELADSDAKSAKWAEEVREAMRHVWRNYKQHAWGRDEIAPLTGQPGRQWCDAAVMMIDSLSTLKIMGLEEEFDEATEWITNNLKFDRPRGLHSFFEITIRVLGGLLSAHSLSGRQIFLDKAEEAADHMMTGFTSYPGCPRAQIDLGTGRSSGNGWMSGFILAEVGTLQLEFRYLTEQTGDLKYAEAVDKCQESIFQAAGGQGLVPYELASDRPMFTGGVISLGAMGDSYFEYLLKVWLQSGKKEKKHEDLWVKAMTEIEKMIFKTDAGLTFIGELRGGMPNHRMEHLTCFVPGNLMLGARTLPRERVDPRWEKWARDITETCHQMYARSKTGLGPEVAEFRLHASKGEDMYYNLRDAHYILRPEAIESIFYMHYFTGDPKYRVWAHDMMAALNKHSKAPYGYSAVFDINEVPTRKKNEQESFFTAETLKYLYLTLAPRHVLNLDEYVLNTEAHPLKIAKQ